MERRKTEMIKDLIKQMQQSKIVVRPISDLLPYVRNSRIHEEWQISQIASSIKEFGFTNPVLIGDDGTIIAGHARVLAALKLNLDHVPCIALGYLTDAQRRAYVIADNKLALNAGWDFDLLKTEFDELKEEEFDLSLTGFSEIEMMNISADAGKIAADPMAEWTGMPEYEDKEPCYRKIIINFDDEDSVQKFAALLEQEISDKTKSLWYPMKERRKLKDLAWGEKDE
jgi:hypothetical protein